MTDPEALALIIRELMRAYLVDERRPQAEGQMSFDTLDFQTLHHTHDTPGMRVGALASAVGVSKAKMTSVVERLVIRGLVERRRLPDDGRTRGLWLTSRGEEVQAAILRQDVTNCESMLEPLKPDERRTLIELLSRVTRAAS